MEDKEFLPIERRNYMNTLTDCVNKVVKDGYTDNYKVTEEGLFSPGLGRHFQPEEVHVVDFFRFEGEADPADNTILYVIEIDQGTKGTLVDAYGPYASERVNRFMKDVEDIQKKKRHKDNP